MKERYNKFIFVKRTEGEKRVIKDGYNIFAFKFRVTRRNEYWKFGSIYYKNIFIYAFIHLFITLFNDTRNSSIYF